MNFRINRFEMSPYEHSSITLALGNEKSKKYLMKRMLIFISVPFP